MKSKLLKALFGVVGLASASLSNATTFVNVSYLGSPAINTVNGRSYTTINTDQTWTRDKVYIIDRLTFVAPGVNIFIQPGTLVRSEIHTVQGDASAPSKPSDPGTLTIAIGAKLFANGTSDAPIIFTSIDDINVPGGLETVPPFENYGTPSVGTDIEAGVGVTAIVNTQRELRKDGVLVGAVTDAEYSYSGGTTGANIFSYTGNSKAEHDGRWGGIVLCGDARVAYGTYTGVIASGALADPTSSASATNNGGQGRQYVEGLQAFGTIAMYGGVDDNDNSGTLRFISNRYGGYVLFSNRELNAFTFGGVGRGTVLEFLEAYNNADDDFEFFGGTVNSKYLISAFGGDDGFDTDQGYTGNVQYFVQIQNNRIAADGTTSTGRPLANAGDNGFEIDGPEPSTSDAGVITMRPFTIQTVANATVIGRGYGKLSADPFPANNCGANLKNAGALRLYNSIYMDFPNGGIAVKAGTPVDFIIGNANGLYGDDTLQDFGTATTDNERYSVFKGNIWYRCALTEVAANSQATIASGGSYTVPTVGTGADNEGFLFGVNNRANSTTDNPTSVVNVIKEIANSNQFNVDPGLIVPINHHMSGIDLRCTTDAAKNGGVTLPNRGNLTRVDKDGEAVKFVGAMRDNNWAKGWTAIDRLGYLLASSASIAPSVAISLDGTNPKLTFATVNNVYYSVESSSDNRVFSPIDIVTGNGGNAEVIDAAVPVGSAPRFYRVMAQ